MDTARFLHFQRLRVLYFDPTQQDAQAEVTDEYLSACINMADARLQSEKAILRLHAYSQSFFSFF
jgi:hypothetical protein